MTEIQKSKRYDLEDRTAQFARQVRIFISGLPRTIATVEDEEQLTRSSGSIGANYIEANESLGKKDFLMKIKICRKEAKETEYWLKLINPPSQLQTIKDNLAEEARQLRHIFGAILTKSQ